MDRDSYPFEIVMARLKPNFKIFHYKTKFYKRSYAAYRLIQRYVQKYGNSIFYDCYAYGQKLTCVEDLKRYFKNVS